MGSCNLRNFEPCFSQFREIQLFSQNLTDIVNYYKPKKKHVQCQLLKHVDGKANRIK